MNLGELLHLSELPYLGDGDDDKIDILLSSFLRLS